MNFRNPPHELKVDIGRGVVYLHNFLMGQTVLRVCRIPDCVIRLFEVETVVVDLASTPERQEGIRRRGPVQRRSPSFLVISGADRMLSRTELDTGNFQIVGMSDKPYFEFRNVPGSLLYRLWVGVFVDMTLGITG